MSGIEVLSRTQRIIVLPNTSVSIVKAGPVGPRGPQGDIGPQGLAGVDGVAQEIDQHVPDSEYTIGDTGILSLAIQQDADESFVDEDGDYTVLQTDTNGKLKVSGPLTNDELRESPVTVGDVVLAGLARIEDTTSTSGDAGLPVLVVRKDEDSSSVSTDGDYSYLHVDNNGKLKVSGPVTDAQLRATPIPVEVSAEITGTFTSDALTDTQLRAAPVPISLDAASLAALENVIVTIDAGSLAALETINVSNIAGTEFAEDSAHADGAAGSLSLAVRRDADTSSVSSDGDYAALLVDALGRLKIKHIKDNSIVNGTLIIAIGASISSTGGDSNTGIIDLRAKSLVGIQMPAAWSTAVLTFSASMDGGVTYNDLYDDAMTERSISVVANRTITIDPTKFLGCTHIKFRSGTAASAVNQIAARIINYTTIVL